MDPDPKTEPSRPVVPSPSDLPSGGVDRDETITMASDAEAQPPLSAPAVAGEVGTLGPYRIAKELGRGGMGAVYAAVDTRLGRRLALKVMLPQFAANAAARERFLREARAAAGVKHDNVVTLYEADVRDGVPYIAMEYLEGYPLDEYLKKRGSPTILQILRVATETASGLAAAHKIGLVHRDIKPGNLWLEAPSGRVKVLDFGLAKPVDAEVELTKSGAVVGTPAYMSPEQARGEKVDQRSDLFSLGAVMYRLCTGRLPFEGANTMAVLMALATEEPTPVRELNPNVPEPLAALIHQLLAKRVGDRPQSAAEVAKRIRAIAEVLAAERTLPMAHPIAPPLAVEVPMQVTVPPPGGNPFADLDAPATKRAAGAASAAKSAAPAAPPTTTRTKLAGPLLWVIGGALAFVALVIGGVVIGGVVLLMKKPGSETKIGVVDGAKVTIKEKPGKKTLPQGGPEIKAPDPDIKPPTAVSDPDRAAAEYVLSLGGIVRIANEFRDYKAVAELPNGRFMFSGFDLHGSKVTDVGLARLKDCKGLVYVHLSSTAVTDAGLAHFKDRKEIWFLDLASTAVRDAGLAHFQGCKKLGHLNLRGTYVTDAGLANFKDSKGVGYLNLSNTAITNAGLVHFQGCKDLANLDLVGTAVTDAGLAHLKGCTGLTHLFLHDLKVTGAGLASFQNCTELRFLDLSGTAVTDAGLAHLKASRAIFLLNLSATAVTDAGLAQFKDCKDVGHLQLDGTAVTDAGLAYFKDCKGLGYLGLFGTKVTNAGLAPFHECKGLAFLNLAGTQVTANGLAAFHAAVPGCRIQHDGGTMEPKK